MKRKAEMKTVQSEQVFISLMYFNTFLLGLCQFGLQLYEVVLTCISDLSLSSHIKYI